MVQDKGWRARNPRLKSIAHTTTQWPSSDALPFSAPASQSDHFHKLAKEILRMYNRNASTGWEGAPDTRVLPIVGCVVCPD